MRQASASSYQWFHSTSPNPSSPRLRRDFREALAKQSTPWLDAGMFFFAKASKNYFGKPGACLFFLILLLNLPQAAWSSSSDGTHGEIINVSQHYKIAFTDMGQESLAVGDVVQVHISKESLVYLKVIEASVALAKLGFVEAKEFNTDPAAFKQITIGNLVSKVLTNVNNAGPAPAQPQQPDDRKQALFEEQLQGQADEITALREKLKEEQARNVALTRQLNNLSSQRRPVDGGKDQCLKKINELTGVIQKLKSRLETMEQITQKASLNEKSAARKSPNGDNF